MERSEILAKLKVRIASALELDEEDISEDSSLLEDLDADSLDVLELVLALQDEFGITVSDGEVKQLLSELARFVPDLDFDRSDQEGLTDQQLGEVAQKLTVGTIVDFVVDRLPASSVAVSDHEAT